MKQLQLLAISLFAVSLLGIPGCSLLPASCQKPPEDTSGMTQRMKQLKKERSKPNAKDKSPLDKFEKGMDKRMDDAKAGGKDFENK